MPFSARHTSFLTIGTCLLALCLLGSCTGATAQAQRPLRPLPIPAEYLPVDADTLTAWPPELQEYYHIWQETGKALSQKAIAQADYRGAAPLPPSPRQLCVPVEAFRKGRTQLLNYIARMHAAPGDAPRPPRLEELLVCHAVQEKLCRIYHAADQMQRVRGPLALTDFLTAIRQLQELSTAPCTRGLAHCDEAARLTEALAPWLALWQQKTPLCALGGPWALTGGSADTWVYQSLYSGPMVFFSAPLNDAKREELLKEFTPSEDGTLCLRQCFERPTLTRGQQLFLITPPLPAGTILTVNGIPLPLKPNAPEEPQDPVGCRCLALGNVLDHALLIQRICVQMPAHAVGTPMLPLCLAASATHAGTHTPQP